jgi:hypothetical protein
MRVRKYFGQVCVFAAFACACVLAAAMYVKMERVHDDVSYTLQKLANRNDTRNARRPLVAQLYAVFLSSE